MNVQQLRYFLTMMETGSVSRAAVLSAVTQPTLSAALKRLEEHFGTKLFVPEGRGLRPLPAARQLESHVRAAVKAISDARRAVTVPALRPLRIGLLPSLAPAWLAPLTKTCEGEAHIYEASAEELSAQLSSGRLDLALTTLPGGSKLRRRLIVREHYQLFVGPAHEFAGRRHVSVADLRGQPYVLRECCELLGNGKRLLHAAGVQLRIVAKVRQEASAAALVRTGVGVTLAAQSWGEPGIVGVEVGDLSLERAVSIAWKTKEVAKAAAAIAARLEAQAPRTGLSAQ